MHLWIVWIFFEILIMHCLTQIQRKLKYIINCHLSVFLKAFLITDHKPYKKSFSQRNWTAVRDQWDFPLSRTIVIKTVLHFLDFQYGQNVRTYTSRSTVGSSAFKGCLHLFVPHYEYIGMDSTRERSEAIRKHIVGVLGICHSRHLRPHRVSSKLNYRFKQFNSWRYFVYSPNFYQRSWCNVEVLLWNSVAFTATWNEVGIGWVGKESADRERSPEDP